MSKLGQVFVIGAAFRFLLPLMVPGILDVLSSSVVTSTPIDSFRALHEGFYYLEHNMPLYDGGVVHHPPLLVVILSLIHSLGEISTVIFHALWTAMDLYIAYRIIGLNRWYNERSSQRLGRKVTGFNDDLIASFYLFNPLLVLTNISHSSLVFSLLCFVEALHQLVVAKNTFKSALALSATSYLYLHSVFLVVPMTALSLAVSDKPVVARALEYIGTYCGAVVALLMASYASISSWSFINSCYGTVLFFNKITPNLGLWWYIFTEMFEFFTPFYIGLFNLYSFIFVIPIALRLYEPKNSYLGDSFLAVVLTYFWISFTKSYPTIGDLAFGLSLLPIFSSTIFPYCKYAYASGLALLVSLLLSPIFYYCWIVLGNGNSNFFYSISLSWGGVHIAILMDLIWGKLTSDYVEENKVPENEKSKLRLTQV